MKRAGTIFTSLGMVLLFASMSLAAGSNTLTVTAAVVGTCKFTAPGTSALAFGTLPFDVSGNALGTSATATPTFWCTNGASYTIIDDDGLNETGVNANRMKSDTLGTPEYIAYSLSYAPATGAGLGPLTPITLTITGTVGATYSANSPDTYSDTVTLTITP